MKRIRNIKWFYLLACLLHVAALMYGKDFNWVYIISKLLLMPLLIALAWNYKRMTRVFKRKWSLVIAALSFSFLGDLFLLNIFEDELFFLLGLTAFLITHIIYIRCFIGGKWHLLRFAEGPVLLLVIPILLWTGWYYIKLFDQLGSMLIPVSIYVLFISLMALSAAFRYPWASRLSFVMVLSGALLFMLSDSMVAWQLFIDEFNYSGTLIMGTYLAGQYLIVEGLHKQDLLLQSRDNNV